MAVTNLATAYTALSLGLTGREGWEVVVEQEALIASLQHVVYQLLVELGTQSTGRERHGLTALEDGATVGHGQRRHFTPDGADVGSLATVETLTLVEDAAAHGIAHHVVVVACGLGMLFLELVGREVGMGGVIFLHKVGDNLVEGVHTGVLLQRLLVDIVYGGVELALDLLAQLFVVDLVAVLALHVLAQFLGQLVLQLAHRLDGLGSSLEGADEVLLRYFLHLAFHHHDVVLGGTYHQVHIGLFHLLEGGVDDKLAVDAGYANLRDSVLEGNVGAGHSG